MITIGKNKNEKKKEKESKFTKARIRSRAARIRFPFVRARTRVLSVRLKISFWHARAHQQRGRGLLLRVISMWGATRVYIWPDEVSRAPTDNMAKTRAAPSRVKTSPTVGERTQSEGEWRGGTKGGGFDRERTPTGQQATSQENKGGKCGEGKQFFWLRKSTASCLSFAHSSDVAVRPTVLS